MTPSAQPAGSATESAPPGSALALTLATLAFALCFTAWGLVAPLAPTF
jgi:nitrate/nitrite transporter NarK